ncbi:MAG: NAD-dependent epimerase/dehydratase family protein [Planctomycetes bacterium]|nr:NAD-dependent epimerase/dehydratase family protein [Planctomycetota bacterium]
MIDYDYKRLLNLILRIKPAVIIHLAANASVRLSLDKPLFDYTNNIEATIKLINFSLPLVKHFIFFSTAGVYKEKTKLPINESSQIKPASFYGVSKLTGENIVVNSCSARGIKYTIFRPSNIYGPRQRHHLEGGVVSIFIERMLSNKKIYIYGDGRQTRDFIYAGDVARAIEHVINNQITGIFNLSTEIQTSINNLFKQIKEKTNFKQKPVYKPPIQGEIRYSSLSYSKLKKTGWKPLTLLAEGINKTLQYFANVD